VLATQVTAGEPALLPKEVREREPRFDDGLVRPAIDRNRYGQFMH
jgi:hypothetical protein